MSQVFSDFEEEPVDVGRFEIEILDIEASAVVIRPSEYIPQYCRGMHLGTIFK